jgi:hypothetical protein
MIIEREVNMKVGTKSLLFGVHQFIIHPIFIAIAWTKLFGFPKDPKLWIAFIVHDWGYWGKPNMDGKEGEIHPELGARIMHRLFDDKGEVISVGKYESSRWYKDISKYNYWYNFMLYHSRFYAKKYNHSISKLCIADKYVFCIQPRWMYLPMASWSGEIFEYMDEKRNRSGHSYKDKKDWFKHVKCFMHNWVREEIDKFNIDLSPDGTKGFNETIKREIINVSNGTLKS